MRVYYRTHALLGENSTTLLRLLGTLVTGWPLYLWFNVSSGQVASDLKSKLDRGGHRDHFRPSSQIMPDALSAKVMLSTAGCLCTLAILVHTRSMYAYAGPYLVVNAWLVLYTWLHHAHVSVPHYGLGTEGVYSHTVGALCTVDRPYPWLIDHLHHHLGTTHVVHHLNYGVPHYRAVACTEELTRALEASGMYRYDATPIHKALWQTFRDCVCVNGIDGVQYYVKPG